MVGIGQAVFDPVGLADHVKAHRPGTDGVPVAGLLAEPDAIVHRPAGHQALAMKTPAAAFELVA